MKVFDSSNGWYDQKVNFVDSNNVFVGYDTAQSCCEDAGWFIAEKVIPYSYEGESLPEYDTDGYVFDIEFFQEVESCDLDDGGQVAFRLACDGKPDLYLHLYNCHNGHYGHGFFVKHGGETVKDGCL